MEKIKAFAIKKLRLEGFKKFLEPTEFDFGTMTYISGHNSQGKTSIADAITYAIAGTPYFGGERGIDRLYSMETKDMKVTMTIEADGAQHELVRERVNDTTTLTYDGTPIRQTDLTTMFGGKDVFLSIFNPLYFIEELGDKGRNLLARYLPAVPHEDVIDRLSEKNRKLIEAAKMTSPEGQLARLRDEIKELNDSIIYYEGQRDLLANQVMDKGERLREMQAQQKETEIALTQLHEKRYANLDFNALEQKRAELYVQLEGLSRSAETPDTGEIDNEIQRYTLSLEQLSAKEYKSTYTQGIAEMRSKLDQRIADYQRAGELYKALRPGMQCPTCMQKVTEENVGAAQANVAESANEIAAEGKLFTEQLNELLELDKKAHDVFVSFKRDDIAKLEQQLADARARRERITTSTENVDRQSQISSIKAQIQSLDMDIKNGNLNASEMETYNTLYAKFEKQYHEIAAFEAQESGSPDDKAQQIDKMQETLKEKKELETAVRFYISERINLLFSGFNMLQKVSIQLYEVVKSTGEVKDVFRFSYDDRPYKYLSYSEKVKAGLELSELIKKLTGSNYPVFIDNGESVPVIDNVVPTGQVIVSQVVKKAPLTVTAMDSPGQQAAA